MARTKVKQTDTTFNLDMGELLKEYEKSVYIHRLSNTISSIIQKYGAYKNQDKIIAALENALNVMIETVKNDCEN